jgi:thymidine kinase
MGSLTILLSSMQGGKTTEILRLLTGETFANQKALYINHSLDTRSAAPFSTHNPLYKVSHLKNISSLSTTKLKDIPNDIYNKYDVIGIDEAQFFEDITYVIHIVDNLKKRVYVCGLNGDYQRNVFGSIYKLIPHADDIRYLKDVWCVYCAEGSTPSKSSPLKKRKYTEPKMTRALFSHRISDSTGSQIEVGASNYVPLCRECYLDATENRIVNII